MDKELKLLLDNSKLDKIYNNNLFSIKSICEFLGIWDNYSSEKKFNLENFTKRDSSINKHFTYEGEYDKSVVYGEVSRKGADTLISKINKYKKPTEKDVFLDVGSGCGKLVLHLSIKSKIKTLIGVEKIHQRNMYAKHIKDQVSPIDDKAIFFIEKDILDFDLSIPNIVFINDVCIENSIINEIFDKVNDGCHFISSKIINCKIMKEEFEVDASWGKLKLYYYIK
jgi:hypothetical protein